MNNPGYESREKMKNIENIMTEIRKDMKKYHADHIHVILPIIAHYEPRFPSYLLDFSNYLNIKVLPVASYYAGYIKLYKELR